jgi:RNA polymerase sigma-70 factor, ECF subfamily
MQNITVLAERLPWMTPVSRTSFVSAPHGRCTQRFPRARHLTYGKMTASLELVPDDRGDELALVRAATSGDEAAFEQIYRAHSARVFALCLRLSGSRARAVELTQDVFVHLWRRLDSWRGDSALSSWIHRVTVNLVLSNARGETRRQKWEMNHEDEPEHRRTTGGASAAAAGVVPPRAVGDAIDLERAIATLPERARTVFVLHDVEGYQHAEIARMTGTAEGTCRAQLHRARRLLMDALGGER